MKTENKIFLDGAMVATNESLLDSLTPGVLSGDGVFETMRSYDGKIFAVQAHLARLMKGMSILKIKPPFKKRKFQELLHHSLSLNRLNEARIRLTVWRKNGRVRMAIVTSAYRPYPFLKYKHGFSAVISEIRRNETSKLSQIKSIDYLPLLTAFRKAVKKGYDEALLLNRRGYLAEASRSNIFYIINGKLFTPDLASGCLNGITRHIVLQLARRLKVAVKQGRFTVQELLRSDEAFLTNSLMGIMPLTTLEGKRIAAGRPGPLTAKFRSAYQNLTRR